jgi:hypothetical protein
MYGLPAGVAEVVAFEEEDTTCPKLPSSFVFCVDSDDDEELLDKDGFEAEREVSKSTRLFLLCS